MANIFAENYQIDYAKNYYNNAIFTLNSEISMHMHKDGKEKEIIHCVKYNLKNKFIIILRLSI